jgi:putative lipoprotein
MRPPRSVFARLASVIALVVAGGLSRPAPALAADDLFGRDKALHFAASAGIALGGYAGAAVFTVDRPTRLVTGGGLALAAGIGKEISDRYTGGDPSWRDLGWDVIGTATGLTLAYMIDWGIRRWW